MGATTFHPARGLIGELKSSRQKLISEHLEGMPGSVFVREYTDWMEGLIKRLFKEAVARQSAFQPVCLVALGGFGRKELNLGSDVDLMFLYPKASSPGMESLAQQVLYPLWDLKLEVGHAARTLDECLQMAAQDFSVLVSLLTARPLAGATAEFTELTGRLAEALRPQKAKREFWEKVRAADLARRDRFGHTPYLLEPHLKEGEGGLRDIHVMTWVGLGCFDQGSLAGLAECGLLSEEEVAEIREAREFLWRVRNHLHYLAGGRDERLTFEAQEQVASFLGFQAEGSIPAVEVFMRAYYTRAFGVRNTRDLFFERAGARLASPPAGSGQRVEEDFVVIGHVLGPVEAEIFSQRPELMMRLFAAAARSGRRVSHQARQEVRRRLDLADEAYRRDLRVRQDFYAVLMAPRLEAEALSGLHHSGLLKAYLPEMEGVFQLPQHDAYHLYTVDVHQILTVNRLSELAVGRKETEPERLAQDLLNQLSRPRLLYLAALCHDLGKAGGKGHAERGAEMVRPVLERLDLKDEEAGLVRFLIANHLFLTETATRRDIHDEKLLFAAARQIGDEERLAMLYLLTIADSQATGPQAWSSWQSTLVREFYTRILATMNRTDIAGLGSPEWLADLREEVARLLEGRLAKTRVEEHLDQVSDPYLLAADPQTIAAHISLVERLKGRQVAWEVEEKEAEGYCQVNVALRQRRGLFGRLAGVMTLNGLNILGAQIHVRSDGVMINVFQLDFPTDPLTRPEKWAKLERDVERALAGRLALAVRLAQKQDQTQARTRRYPHQPPAVSVDNTVSDFHTVIEVICHDRLGLLYDVTRVLFDLDLEIHIAKVSTKVDQVLDVFYVTNLENAKVDDEEQIKEIKEALAAIVG